MEFRILGPLEVRAQDRNLPLGGLKQRALLAVLLLHANEVVSTDHLIDELWGGNPPVTVTDASTVAKAFDVLFEGGNSGSAIQQLDRQLLAAWLNFANGSFEYGALVDTNGDAVPDTPFSTVMATAEAVRLNPASTADQLRGQRDLLERING